MLTFILNLLFIYRHQMLRLIPSAGPTMVLAITKFGNILTERCFLAGKIFLLTNTNAPAQRPLSELVMKSLRYCGLVLCLLILEWVFVSSLSSGIFSLLVLCIGWFIIDLLNNIKINKERKKYCLRWLIFFIELISIVCEVHFDKKKQENIY